jgi:hypothetical protein
MDLWPGEWAIAQWLNYSIAQLLNGSMPARLGKLSPIAIGPSKFGEAGLNGSMGLCPGEKDCERNVSMI